MAVIHRHLISVFFSISFFIIDSLIPLGVAGGIPYVLIVLMALWSRKQSFAFILAGLGTVLTILGFYTSPAGGELWQVIFNRVMALGTVWITAFLVNQRIKIWQEKERTIKELKYMQGIIPICSYCHAIRDDKGAWKKLESYISNHTDAQLSHGICPKCYDQHRVKEDPSDNSI